MTIEDVNAMVVEYFSHSESKKAKRNVIRGRCDWSMT